MSNNHVQEEKGEEDEEWVWRCCTQTCCKKSCGRYVSVTPTHSHAETHQCLHTSTHTHEYTCTYTHAHAHAHALTRARAERETERARASKTHRQTERERCLNAYENVPVHTWLCSASRAHTHTLSLTLTHTHAHVCIRRCFRVICTSICFRSCFFPFLFCFLHLPSPPLWNSHRNSFKNETFSTKTTCKAFERIVRALFIAHCPNNPLVFSILELVQADSDCLHVIFDGFGSIFKDLHAFRNWPAPEISGYSLQRVKYHGNFESFGK